ncbi:MAG TPA: YfiR family protein [Terriglobales bacterium]|nr:YfiR family protein [Terriglobales bacterium]
MDEYSVKAGYIYNFSKYVTWPETAFRSPSAPFVICIAGRDPFEGRLDQAIAGKTTGDSRALEVKKVSASDRAGFRECHLVFVSKSEQGRAAAISENLKELPVFIVADFDSFAERGGIADLRIEGSKVKVDLNVGAASRVGLKISAKLQQVANLIH